MKTVDTCKLLVEEAFVAPEKWESNFSQAQELLSTALVEDPANPLLLTCLGTVLCDQGKHEQAMQALRNAVKYGSQDRNTFFNLGVAVLNVGNHEEAMQLFSKACLLQPSDQSWEAYFDPHAH